MAWVTRQIWISDAEIEAERHGYLTAAEACRQLKCSRSKLMAMVRTGDVGHCQRGGHDLFSAGDVELIQRGCSPGEMRRAESAALRAEMESAFPGSGAPHSKPDNSGGGGLW